jgi:hypothetical protein
MDTSPIYRQKGTYTGKIMKEESGHLVSGVTPHGVRGVNAP